MRVNFNDESKNKTNCIMRPLAYYGAMFAMSATGFQCPRARKTLPSSEAHRLTCQVKALPLMSRRELFGLAGVFLALTLPSRIAYAAAEDAGAPESTYTPSRRYSMPLGAGTMPGKSKPVTGVNLMSEPKRLEDGTVVAELKGRNGQVLAASFKSPWPLATGDMYDVEARDRSHGEGCYLQVEPTSANVRELPVSFFTDAVLALRGRFGAYGAPSGVKIISDTTVPTTGTRVVEFTFDALSPTYTEQPRHAMVAASTAAGTGDVVMLVGSASASRWKQEAAALVGPAVRSLTVSSFDKGSAKARGAIFF